MARFFAYGRVSTESQTEKFGLELQRENVEKYAQEHGLTIERWFIDAGISGAVKDTEDSDAISKRPGLIELLATLSPGDTILTYSTSRLWRSEVAKVIIRRELLRKQVNVIAVDNPRFSITNTGYDRFFDVIAEAMDELERTNIAVKLQRGRTAKAQQGKKPCGICPFGYAWSADRQSVEIDEREAQVVRMMFREGARGDSLQEIANKINATGARTRRGKPFSKGSIAFILSNEFYISKLKHGEITVQGTHPALVTKQTFGRVQAALKRRKRG